YDGHPYVAPFSGNIVELCPVGALTSQPYRFRARPWDIEDGAGICTLCSSQCNVAFTVRDERVMRVLARQNDGVDDGWLCDKGRFAYQAMHVDERITQPLVRDGGELRQVSWERALQTAAGLARHAGRVGTLVGGRASNEEGFLLQRLAREALASSDIDSRGAAGVGTACSGPIPANLARALAAPALQASVPDIEFAHTVLLLGCDPRDDSPILDLRIRKGVRRNGVKLAIVSARPTALEDLATLSVRCEPGGEGRLAAALARALDGAGDPVSDDVAALAELLRSAGEDVVILYGERIEADGAAALVRIAAALGLADRQGAGLMCLPAGANGRGLREAGAVPDAGPGYADLDGPSGRDAAQIGAAAADGELTALHLFAVDPVRDLPGRATWERALGSAALVVAHASVLTEGLREHANVIFPAESHAEKEGTLVHPDGRLQRMRIAIAHPGEVRAGWAVLAEIARRCGLDTGAQRSEDVFRQLVDAVPAYEGLTLEEVGGRGVRWPERPQAAAYARGVGTLVSLGPPEPGAAARSGPGAPLQNGSLRLGTYRPIWASPECEVSPALKFLIPGQQVELSPGDAQRLGIADGSQVSVSSNGTRLSATAVIRTGVPDGSAFLADGLARDSANALTDATVEVHAS
ncbi:MAG: molybdopterin oxidoreductase family protein, partial [Solirubrobacteraceae bacterium]